uniref:Uncharacterized protein n=1 Tax=Macaca fascicularis TaxID=9541 RepID=A0A7N9CM05_MACFA
VPLHSSLGNKSKTPSQNKQTKEDKNVPSVLHNKAGVKCLFVFPFWDRVLLYFVNLHFPFFFLKRSVGLD